VLTTVVANAGGAQGCARYKLIISDATAGQVALGTR
jgi:hypothetical protein